MFSARVTHVVPVEAVRQGVTAEGSVTMARLAADHAEFRPDATVELFPEGWVATLVYAVPGAPRRMHFAHVGLVWHPLESALGGEGRA
jgi:hypothetical protein